MHKYLRAIGFSGQLTRKDMEDIAGEALANAVYRACTSMYPSGMDAKEDTLFAEFRLECGPRFGISFVGELDENDDFSCEYSYPFLYSPTISTTEPVNVESRLDTTAFSGICDDLKVGVTIIFRLQNIIDHIKRMNTRYPGGAPRAQIVWNDGMPEMTPLPAPFPENGDGAGTAVSFAALSIEGSIMLPIMKTETDRQIQKKASGKRLDMMERARHGDEDAIKKLTIEDMDNYSLVLDKMQQEDVYSIVDTYFMPFGVECDLYSVLAEIRRCEQVANMYTGEILYRMQLSCNELLFELLINRSDLFGEPAVGRRFKGIIWMQGTIQYPDNVDLQ